MVVRVNLPPGCDGLNMEDGTRYSAPQSGGTVTVADHHARAIDKLSTGGNAGLVSASFRGHLGTKRGQWCEACARIWNAWNDTCPKCGAGTVEDT
jgi:hypothetical protein